jgi:hypothetical protein
MLNTKCRILVGLFFAFLIIGSASSASAQSCPSGALPGSICGSGTGLADGASACVGPFSSNGTSVEMNGQATGAAPRWTIHWSQTDPSQNPPPPDIKLFKTTALGVTADIINNSSITDPLTLQPESTYFPGYFTACVFNYETGVSINYLISIGPGQY